MTWAPERQCEGQALLHLQELRGRQGLPSPGPGPLSSLSFPILTNIAGPMLPRLLLSMSE